MKDEDLTRIGISKDGSFEPEDLPDDRWVQSLLDHLPETPIPDVVSERILAALSTESLARSEGLAAAHPAETAEARPTADTTALADADAAPPVDAIHARSNRRWWWAAGGVAAAGIGAVLAVSSLPIASTPSQITAEPVNVEQQFEGYGDVSSPVTPVSSGSTYTAENVRLRVPEVIESSAAAASPDVLRATFAETPAGINSCLDGVGFPPQNLALLDIARFQGSPVAVLAYLTDQDEATADVVIVGIRCSRTDPQVRHRDIADMALRGTTQPE